MWTREQQDAIDARGGSLLVAAAAGSGKTAVLTQRILALCREGASVDRMLVVTFTNAAAAEMRARILAAFSAEADAGDPAFAEQAALVERADICTLHRFCIGVLREHFQAAGVDPSFRLGDEAAVQVLRESALADAIDARYESGDPDFLALTERMTDEEVAAAADALYAFLLSRADPWPWLDRAVDAYAADPEGVARSPAAALLLSQARALLAQAQRLLEQYAPIAAFSAAHEALCAQDAAVLDALCRACDEGLGALREAMDAVSFARLPTGKAAREALDEAQTAALREARDAMKATVQKKLGGLLEFSPEQAAQDMASMQPALRGLRTLVRTYDALFAAAKAERNTLDFHDLEHKALAALASDAVAQSLRAHYDFIFVDEYQDSSAIQEALLSRVTRGDNLFFVGDVKQSIYRFRQADPSLFLEKYARFSPEPGAPERRIDLNRNFRSRKNVLEAVNAVFAYCMRADETEIEYDAAARLYPGLRHPDEDPPVELHLLADPEETDVPDGEEPVETEEDADAPLESLEQEAAIACARIRSLVGTPVWDAKAQAHRPLAYRDFAILLRSTQHNAPRVARLLLSQGIPAFCDAGEGYFDMPEVRMMLDILRVVDNAAQDEPLIAVLHGPAVGLSDEELAAVRIACPEGSYAQAARAYAAQADALGRRLAAFYERLAGWRLRARHQSLSRLILGLLDETGLYARAGALPGGEGRQANLRMLAERAQAYEAAQGGGLYGFLRQAERLRRSEDTRTAKTLGEGEDVVRILSMHKSKGLEYPVVIALGLGRRFNARSLNERLLLHPRLGIGVKCVDPALRVVRPSLPHTAIRLQLQRESLAEETRILYVAMTRARDRLILIGRAKNAQASLRRWAQPMDALSVRVIRSPLDMVMPPLVHAGAQLRRGGQALQAGDARWLLSVHIAPPAQERQADSAARLREGLLDLEAAPPPQGDVARVLLWHPPQRDELPAKTSVSALVGNASDTLPELQRQPGYMEQRILSGARRGTLFHAALRAMDLERIRAAGPGLREEIVRTLDALVQRGVFTPEERAAVHAEDIFTFFVSSIGQRMLYSTRVEREWAFNWLWRDASGREALVQGVIDCCFLEEGAWVLVDYKTDGGEAAEAIARHRPQVALYAQALSQITGLPVRERALYLTRRGRAYVC